MFIALGRRRRRHRRRQHHRPICTKFVLLRNARGFRRAMLINEDFQRRSTTVCNVKQLLCWLPILEKQTNQEIQYFTFNIMN